MIYIDEIKDLKIYKHNFLLPRNGNDKRKNNAIFLLTPNYESSKNLINHPLMINNYYNSYFLDKNVSLYINEYGNLSRIPESEEYIHESVSEDATSLNEGLYTFHKKEIIYNGHRSDVEEAKLNINNQRIELFNKYFKVRLKYPICVTVYPKKIPNNIHTTSRDIYITNIDNIPLEYYTIYCNEAIINMLIHNINENIHPYLCKCICMVISGGFKEYKDDFYDNDMANFRFGCEAIENIIKSQNGYHKLYTIIQKNDYKKVLKAGINSIVTTNEAGVEDLKSLKRKIKMRSRKGSKYAANKINRDISKVVDPNEKNPDFTSSEEGEKVNMPNAAEVKARIKNAIKPPSAPNVKGDSGSVDEYSYDTTKFDLFTESTEISKCVIDENSIICDGIITFFNEASSNYSSILRKILYRERIKNNKAVINIYDKVKSDCPKIKYTYLSYNKYKSKNLFVDLYYYNELYFKNSMYNNIRGFDIYKEFLYKLLNNDNFKNSGYNQKKTILIPVLDWNENPNTKMWMYKQDLNPISIIYKLILNKDNKELKRIFGDSDIIFIGSKNYFKVNFSNDVNGIGPKFLILIKKIISAYHNNETLPNDEDNIKKDSTKAITMNIIDNIEDTTDIKISNLTGNTGKDKLDDKGKKELVDKIEKAAATSDDAGEALDKLGEDDKFKKLLLALNDEDEEDNGPKINNARKNRMEKLNNEFMDKQVKGKTIKEILNDYSNASTEKLVPKSLKVDSINEEWKELYLPSMSDQYDPEVDIVVMLRSLYDKTYPIMIRDINVINSSTSEDYIHTYEVDMENHIGKRFKLKFDVPILKNGKYMKLRGNKKNISTQIFLMPLVKTDEDSVQIVSNYSKIFVRTFNTSTGKSNIYADYLIKGLKKYTENKIKVTEGDNLMVCKKYVLPIDYIDLASVYSKIETDDYIFYFNIDSFKKNIKEKIDFKKGIPIGINKKNNELIYFNGTDELETVSEFILFNLCAADVSYNDIIQSLKPSTKYTYSKASIMSTEIPVIILAGYSEGLTKVLDKAGIKYRFVEKRPKRSMNMDIIKFSDGYLEYKTTQESSLLLNGLKECSTEAYSVSDMNKKSTFLNFIEQFGGRLKADGFDNFYDCMIDPITKSVLEHLNLPTDYVSLLIYANNLLVNNNFISNDDMSGRRLRRNELIAAYAYKAIAGAYGNYANMMRHGRETIMSMKQSAIIDAILLDNTGGDLSILNALGEKEAYDQATYKGLSGMNNDRSYSLDKRGYSKSMINVLGMSTGFANTVGINRQLTINSNVDTVRGFIKLPKEEEMNSVNSLCMSEALTPMGTTRDDPFRSAMTYIQTTKHGMRTKKSDPLLVTNGADEALPYLISDIFAHKAKKNGTILEVTDDYIIVKYGENDHEYINLKEEVEKNSSAGFYVNLKLDTDLKVGDKVKEGDIIAYDKSSFATTTGINNNPAYKIGTLACCALLDTSEGFEDSTIISEDLANAMSNDVIVEVEKTFNKNTNIYNMVNIGDPIEEGDTLLVIQNAYDEDDANKLLKKLVDDPDEISDLGRIPIKSKVTGVVQDIKVYRTVEMEELSESLQKLCKKYEKDIKAKKNVMNKYKIDQLEELEPDYKLQATGKLKDAGDGVKIIFYLKYNDLMSIGDKLINWSANKGVIKTIMPRGKEAYILGNTEELVHCLVSVASCNGRMITSIQNIGIQNRLLIEAARKAKQMAGLPINYNTLIFNKK